MSNGKTYTGSCFCGDVQFTVNGEPVAMGYCHCESCRRWSAGPVNAFTLWKPEAVQIMRGADNIGTYNNSCFTNWDAYILIYSIAMTQLIVLVRNYGQVYGFFGIDINLPKNPLAHRINDLVNSNW